MKEASARHLRQSARRAVQLGGAGAVAGTLLMVFAGTASAHVTVSAPGATRGGGDQVITFRVPTESDSASTVGFKLQLPAATPIASVLVQPVAGWSFTETTAKLPKPIKTDDGDITEAVTEIDWKADNKAAYVGPSQFQQFVIIAGLLPDTAQLVFRAIQNYSDGSSVNWTEVPAAGSTEEPEHGAPILALSAASMDASPSPSATMAPQSTTKSTSNAVPIAIAVAAVVVAVAALALALRRPRTASPS